jgi:hypothetical protein
MSSSETTGNTPDASTYFVELTDTNAKSITDAELLSRLKFDLDFLIEFESNRQLERVRREQHVELEFARRQRDWRVRLGVGEQPEHFEELRQLLKYEQQLRSRWNRRHGFLFQ